MIGKDKPVVFLFLIFLLVFAVAAPLSAAPLADYHFDECYWNGSASEVLDASGNGHHGTAKNGVTTVAEGQVCRAGEFSSGSSQYVDLGSGFSPGSNSWSVSVWFKWDGSSGENIIYNKENLFEARVQGGYFQYAWQPHWAWDGGTTFPVTAGAWTHAVVTYDGSSQRVYKNGVLAYERAQGGSMGSNGNKLLIGARGNSSPQHFFGGRIDEVLIYSEALTDTQVIDLYNNQRDRKNPDGSDRTCPVCEFTAIASYYLDECAWNGSSGEVVDASGNGYYGTAVNGVTTVDDGKVCRAGKFADNGYLSLPDFPDVTTDFTITAWIKTDNRTASGQRIFADDEQNTHGYALSLGDGGTGRLRFYSRGISPIVLDTPAIIDNDTWYFVAGVADITSHERHIYVFTADGTLVNHTSGSYSGPWGTDAGTASIGGETNNGETGNRFAGNLDEVQVFTGAIDESGLAIIMPQNHSCSCITPLAEYHFDECYWDGSVSEVIDASGNGHHGTAKNGVTTVAEGQVCRAGEFSSGSSQYVDLGSGFSPGSSSWSVSVWFKWDGSSGENIIYNKENLFEARVQGGYFQYAWEPHWYWDGGSSFPVTAGEWTHAVVTYDGSSQRVYKNGALVYERVQGGSMGSNGNKLLIGARGNSSPQHFFGGQIDELLIYSEALSAAQVIDLYNNQLDGKNPDGSERSCPVCEFTAIGSYYLDECAWDGSSGEVVDASGNGYHGTSMNGVTTVDDGKVCRAGEFVDNGYLALPGFPDLTSDFTMTSWIKTSDRTRPGQRIFADDERNSGGYALSLGDGGAGRLRFYSRDISPVSLDTQAVIDNDTWYFVAGVADISNHERHIYVFTADGTLINHTSGSFSGSWETDTGTASIGGETNNGESGNRFIGNLDEVQVFTGAIDESGLAIIMRQNHSCSCITPLADYHFDECYWDGSVGEVIDASGNGHHGTAKNGVTTVAEGQVCRAGDFSSGSSQYVDLGTGFSPGSSSWSVSVWFQWDGSSGENIIYNKENLFEARVQGGYFQYAWEPHWYWDGGSSFPVTAGEWTHAVVTYDGSSQRVYKNGALVYERTQAGAIGSNGSKLLIGARGSNNPHNFFGGQIDELLIYSEALSDTQVIDLYNNQLDGKNPDGSDRLCSSCSSVDHFIITDEDNDQQALACRGELITIQAVDGSGDLLSNYTGSVSLSADNGALWYDSLSGLVNDDPPHGSWTGNGHGSATYHFVTADNGQVKLWLRDSDIPASGDREVVSVSVVDGTAAGTLEMVYHKAGFRLVWDNPGNTVQLSGKPSDQGWNGQNIVLQAIQVNPATGACESLLDGSLTVQAKISYLDPSSGSEPFNLTGTEVDENWTAVSLDFDQGEAPLIFRYDDAGRLQLEIRYDSDGDGVFDMFCINNPAIIFRPLGFYLFTTTANGLADSGADSSAFVKAGTTFNLSSRAVIWQQSDDTDNDGIPDATANLEDNGVTANYQAGGNPLTHSLIAPAGGDPGSLGTTSMAMVNGSGAVADQTFSEVGIITLTMTDADYLGSSGASITGTSRNLGRFIPDHFDVQSTAVSLAPFCNNFTYLGQNFGYQEAPRITISARNSNNEETKNYRDDFFKLPATLTPSYSNNVSGRTLNVTPASISLAAVSSQTVTVADTFSYLREPVSPFDADFDLTLAVSDSDGVLYGSDGNFVINNIGGTQLRSGRLMINDNYGLETEDITHSPFNTQYWDGSGWQLNPDDDCTSGIAFDSLRAHISSNPEVTGGVGYLMVDKPASATPETITICPVFPAWLSCSGTDCCGTFTFGIYRGNDRLILKMEVPE